jgi:hypothetical protein
VEGQKRLPSWTELEIARLRRAAGLAGHLRSAN